MRIVEINGFFFTIFSFSPVFFVLPLGCRSSVPSNSQYRAPFPQLSPQMSPRSHQISPHPQISPRSNVMSPAKPMQPQNVSNNPLSPHGHLPGSGPSPQPRQLQQQASKNAAASQQTGSVSTLQALEQMVMPPSVAPGSVMQASSMDYASSYRPSAQMQHNAAANPLSPMTSIPSIPSIPTIPSLSTSPQHHQQWPAMGRSAMSSMNHQQTAQMTMMQPQQQMPSVSQMNEMSAMASSRGQTQQLTAPQSRMMAGMGQTDSTLTQMDHMHMQPPSIPTSIDPMNSTQR